MASRSPLADALKARTGAVPTTPPEPEHSPHRAPSRRGRRAVTMYVDNSAHFQLRLIALEQGTSVQKLAIEAFNDLFQKLGKPRIAG